MQFNFLGAFLGTGWTQITISSQDYKYLMIYLCYYFDFELQGEQKDPPPLNNNSSEYNLTCRLSPQIKTG